jgi:hypothetical protein
VAWIAPPFTRRIAASLLPPLTVDFRSTLTMMPRIVAPTGMPNP